MSVREHLPAAARTRKSARLLCALFGLSLGCAMPLAQSRAAEPLQAQPGEHILPLGAAEVMELYGNVFTSAGRDAKSRRALQKGEKLPHGQRFETGPSDDSRLSLRFADGSVVRLYKDSAITLLSDVRQVALHRGRVLVAGDRMLGSIAVLTRFRSFLAEGTTYIVDLDASQPNQPPRLELVVLEGAVCACPVAAPNAKSDAKVQLSKNWIVLPGERLDVRPLPAEIKPVSDALTARLKDEPLIAGFAQRLPSWLRIDDLADQQRRNFLPGRNERLRREIFWKRPARPPIKLPELLADPNSVTVRYEYPQ